MCTHSTRSKLTRSSATAEIARVVAHKPHIAKILDSLDYISDSMGLALVNLTQLAPRAAVAWYVKQQGRSTVQDHSKSTILVGDFLLMCNTNLCPIWYYFRVTVAYWSNDCFWQEVLLFNPLVWDELRNSRLRNLAPNKKHYSIPWCTKHFDVLDHLGVDRQCDRRTDGQNYDSNSTIKQVEVKQTKTVQREKSKQNSTDSVKWIRRVRY